METTESCRFCERVVVFVESKTKLHTPFDLPNTFNARAKKFRWRRYDGVSYALVPKSVEGKHGQLEAYICADEDDLDDRDILGYTHKLLDKRILPEWNKIAGVQLLGPTLAAPEAVPCWKFHHEESEEVVEEIESE